MQILLGYHNYYSNRQIILPQYLNGNWIGDIGDDINKAENYEFPEKNINVCYYPVELNEFTTGSNDEFYKYIIGLTEPTAFDCICTRTIIEIIDGITYTTITTKYPDGTVDIVSSNRLTEEDDKPLDETEHTHSGTYCDDLILGLKKVLESSIGSGQFDISSFSVANDYIDSMHIKNEIDLGRPVIIGLDSDLGGTNHWVVGYGYEDYTYADIDKTYSGYIVHFGWENCNNIWINEMWCNRYIGLTINHEHELTTTNNIFDNIYIETKCDCGYRGIEDLFEMVDGEIKSVKNDGVIELYIPNIINGQIVSSIGENAFEGCENLTSITIPDTVTSIGAAAFKGCSSLENVAIPKNVSTIGNNAFENCSGLKTVEFKKNLYDINRIPNIGTSVFAGCNNLEIINVNHRLILDYKNDPNWSAYKEKIQTSYVPTFPTHDINCRTNKAINKYLFEGYNEIYQLEVDCVKVYEITVSSTYPIEFSIYDSNMNLINTPLELSSDECTGVMDAYFNKGTYYIKINYQSYSSSGDFVLTIKPKWETYQIQVIEGTNNILNHLHPEDEKRKTNVYFDNEKGIGFYEFKICAIKADGTEVFPDASTILIKDADNIDPINKCNFLDFNIIAENVKNSNNICLFMDRTGYFYIDITLNNEEYNSVTLTISESSSKDIEVLARYNQSFTEQIISSNTIGDTALKFTINQQSLFEVIINPGNTYNEDVKIVIFRVIYDTTAQKYSYEEKLVSSLPLDKTKINLEVGNYYIGLFNKTTSGTITIKFKRLLELEGIADQVLVCDIDENLPYGTEVRHNGGMLNQNTITIGFTRHLHFKNVTGVPSTSRYDYNFRSNKPSIASVSEYGTVYAEKVGSAIITATYKENSAVVFYIEITVVSNESMEELLIESSLTYSLSSTTDIKDGKYNLELTEYNSPYPWIQYYTWTISSDDDITVTMDYFGRIVASGPGTIILEGIYNVNNKVELRITITVNE